MSAVGGALPTKAALEERMRELGMLPRTREQCEADLLAAFNDDPEMNDDPEQQEWVISGLPEPGETP